ncbi:hypothetical protein E2C01_083635 [Portunus trituberculatus]|uniref:Uncharacterized protein n=1 Tax=Portunus trituberculatus TaxID=210409 RepID=A0A5B7J459_PORTR|nr:hypothetical protein [Portunus trituberculatus]
MLHTIKALPPRHEGNTSIIQVLPYTKPTLRHTEHWAFIEKSSSHFPVPAAFTHTTRHSCR